MARPRVLLDVQGSDRGPGEVIAGGIEAAKAFNVEVIFAGDKKLIKSEMSRRAKKRFSILHAPEIISMEDEPAKAVRSKKESSLVKGIEYVRSGEADAFVSPANTGAVVAASLFRLGRIRGISRPGIGAVIPTLLGKNVLLLDVGANVDCTPENLMQFAIMGNIYAQEILGVPSPKIGLLNIGSEEIKGNDLALNSYFLLRDLENFVGNVEGNHILETDVDVVVCDGFVGNVLIKAYEGGSMATLEFLKGAISKDIFAKLAASLLYPALKKFKKRISAAQFGGAPLLGTKKVVIVAHGNSGAEAIKSAIRVAVESVQHDVIGKIERGLLKHAQHLTAKGVAT
jgi:glycerol-3-phosphate acyltransferase PlsX